MATSGLIDYSDSRNDIIEAALNHAGIVGVGQAVPNNLLAYGNKMLNRMVKHWQTQGIHLWRRQSATLFVTEDVADYDLGSGSGNAHASDEVFRTTISVAEAASQTVLSIADGDNLSPSDYVGIELDDGTMHWTTVVSATSTTVTITAAITDTAAVGNQVYSYTTKIGRPLRVESCQYRTSALIDRPMSLESRNYYLSLPNKTLSGQSNLAYYNPRRESYGTISLYPTPNDSTATIQIDYMRAVEDYDTAANTSDFPSEWGLALVYNLAVLMCPASNKDRKASMLMDLAGVYLKDLLAFDKENTDITMIPDYCE